MRAVPSKIAVLIHTAEWPGGVGPHNIHEHVKLCSAKNSKVLKLYERACANHIMDESDPLNFSTYLLFEETENISGFGDPFSLVDRVINLIVLCSRNPFGYCRLFWSQDNFSSYYYTADLYQYTHSFDFINNTTRPIDRLLVTDVANISKNLGIFEFPLHSNT